MSASALPDLGKAEGGAMIAAGVVALVVVLYVFKKGASLTTTATDASGAPVTAYQGAGPIGVAGAAANAASGGWLATFGNWIGTKVGDATIPDPNAAANAAQAAQNAASSATAASALQSMPIDFGTTTSNPYGF